MGSVCGCYYKVQTIAVLCVHVPVTLSCVYKQYLDMDIHTHMKREKFSIAKTQSLSFTEE